MSIGGASFLIAAKRQRLLLRTAWFFFAIREVVCIGALTFLEFIEFELYWGAVFSRSIHTFLIFFKSNWCDIFWSLRNRNWSKNASGFAAQTFSILTFKWIEKTVFERKFAFSLVVFRSHAAFLLKLLPFFVDFL